MTGAFDSENICAEILKRLPLKSLGQCKCVEKSWYDLIQSPYFKALYFDSNRFIYMFARQSCHFVLYRMDPLLHNNNSSDSTYLHDLRPLLVFPEDSHLGVNFFKCMKLGSKIYFYGLALPSDKKYNTFYTMEEKDLMDIQPSEDNIITNFKQLLTKTKNPMHGRKLYSIMFVANNKLYVLSGSYAFTIFEVFSPVYETWQVLPSPKDDASEFHDYSDGVSYLVVEQEQMVYFATTTLLSSFNLETHQWTIHTYYDSITPAPFTFGLQKFRYMCIPIIGKMAFGTLPNHNHWVSYVCASRPFSRGEEFMQPYLAPDKAFLEVLRDSRFTYMSEQCSSDYILALQDSDGKQQLCIITYGCTPLEKGCSSNEIADYVAVSVYDIPGDFYTSEDSHVYEHDVYASSYADEKAKDGGVMRRHFNAKFQYTKHFIVSNSLHGEITTCFL